MADAQVEVKSAAGAVVANGVTGPDGRLLLPDLPEGYYSVEVQSPNRSNFRGTVLIRAGVTRDIEAFLSESSCNTSGSSRPLTFRTSRTSN